MKIVVLIKTNPFESPRGVEAIRMALGLGSGVHQVEIILMGDAPYLLTEEQERILDYETLEKYISSFEDSEKPFYIEEAFLKNHPDFETVYPYASTTTEIIADKISAGEKFLIF
ncbi:MAG: DsrE family protein [Nitrospirae bacterium]|nr:DsrE family protein [Nitrospirota bacterium]